MLLYYSIGDFCMINEQVFRLKKNGEPYWNCFCRHPELIENYDKAIADTNQTWECHHRFEALFTREELIKYNWYFDVEPNCLIFLTPAEHRKIDSRCKRAGEGNKGKKKSEEHKRKISEAHRIKHYEHHGPKGRHWKLVDGKRVWF